ncbi:MAG: class I SAM-dependent methyltransferase [Acidobacteria bacterium]|nr:class I SAM-dependent methyltransferase [Acidobacteriota bacterium]
MVFLFPLPSEAELAAFYDEAYYGPERKKFLSLIEVGIAKFTSAKFDSLRKLLRPGERMLDVGCGRGTLLRLARQRGAEAYGVERQAPVGHSVPGVIYKTLPDCNFPGNHFQLVVLWHVLEHLTQPTQWLHEIYRILKPGGWLSVAVPNYGGAQANASGQHWFHLDLPRHLWHFREPTLERLLGSIGFLISHRSTLSLEYDWYGTLQSWLNSAFGDDNHLYSLLKGNSREPRTQDARTLALAFLLAAPAFASALLDAARGAGGTLTFIAQKPSQETTR